MYQYRYYTSKTTEISIMFAIIYHYHLPYIKAHKLYNDKLFLSFFHYYYFYCEATLFSFPNIKHKN